MKLTLDFAAFQKKLLAIKDKLDSAVDEKKFLSEVGQMIVFDIKRNARSGNTIEKDGTTKKMEPLAESSIARREWLRREGNAKAVPYRDNLSNLSMSGQLIDSIDYELKGNIIEIDAYGQRQPYRELSGQSMLPIGRDTETTNHDLLEKHQNGDPLINLPARRIVGLRRQIIDRINIMYKEHVRRKLKVD